MPEEGLPQGLGYKSFLMMAQCGISVDHSAMNRALVKYGLQLEAECHGCKHPVSLRQCSQLARILPLDENREGN